MDVAGHHGFGDQPDGPGLAGAPLRAGRAAAGLARRRGVGAGAIVLCHAAVLSISALRGRGVVSLAGAVSASCRSGCAARTGRRRTKARTIPAAITAAPLRNAM